MPSSSPGLTDEDVRRFDERFVNRHDTYAVQHTNGRYARVEQPLDALAMRAHLEGERTIAAYALDRADGARWLCFDCDAEDGLTQLAIIRSRLGTLGLRTLLEASRRGAHLWLLCTEPHPARELRSMGMATISALRAEGLLGQPIELYPSRDRLGGEGYQGVGHAVRLPFGVHRLSGRVYPFLGEQGQPAHKLTRPAAVRWLIRQPRATTAQLTAARVHLAEQLDAVLLAVVDQVARKISLPPAIAPRHTAQDGPRRPRHAESGLKDVDLPSAIAALNASLALPQLIDETHREVALRRSGRGYVGWCPWHDDDARQADGRPGTPSLYVVEDMRHGWSWRCLSTNCGANAGPMHDTFDWLLWHLGGDIRRAVQWARTRTQPATQQEPKEESDVSP